MVATLLVLAVAIILVPVLLLRYARGPTVTWFRRILTTRKWLFRGLVLLGGLTAFFSGVLHLMVIGAVILGAAWLFVLTQTEFDVPDPRRYLP